ncbi:MAG: histidine--tRNA ligase [Firmicutes bacterium]|nr:histidine--tRNA ligase [Bacillota bacterium]
MLATALRGMVDVLPWDSQRWHYAEGVARDICRRFGYSEIRTPVLEQTELFTRTAGEATDVVQKEMYTFTDRGGRSVTMRPEGTAPAARAFVEHKMYTLPQPVKMYYIAPMFRYERPQGGRLRQHTQFGIEVFGSKHPAVDAEVIMVGLTLFNTLGLKDLTVQLNSIGCPECRPRYREALLDYYRPLLGSVCEDCRARFEKNPLRLLDCKRDGCREAQKSAPRTVDYLCEECASHLDTVKDHLTRAGANYTINALLVRGFDYYTRTVFEIVSASLGAQNSVCSGGRYDGLIEEIGGPSTPGVGFGLGLERLLISLDNQGVALPGPARLDVFIATVGERAFNAGIEQLYRLREAGLVAEIDYMGRSLKAQMKFADKFSARLVVFLGDEEIERRVSTVRCMDTGEQHDVPIAGLASWLVEAGLGCKR